MAAPSDVLSRHYKCFRWTVVLFLSSIVLGAGYAVRINGASKYADASFYTASTLLIYMGPYVPFPGFPCPQSLTDPLPDP